MKILYFTDLHLRSVSDRSRYRTDDHYVSQFDEIYELSDIAKEHKVDAILSGGDFLHTPRVSHSLITDIINWAKTLPAPLYTVVGNHDTFAFQTNDVKNSGLGVLFEANIIHRLDLAVFDKVVIKGVHAFLDPRQGDYMFGPEYDGFKKIIVSHNYIFPAILPFDSVLPKDVKTNADVVLTGHYHKPYDTNVGKIRFINPGSLSRWSVDERDRQPTVLLLDTETLLITPIILQSSRPGNEIFDLDAVGEANAKDLNLSQFVNSLEETQFENVDIENLVRQTGLTQGLTSDILEIALTKIREAKEELK